MAHQNEKNTLLDFAKQIIRECAEQPKNSVYKTHTYILKICPTSGYTIEQVGKYLRRVRRGIARSKLSPPVKDYSQNLPYVTNLLTTKRLLPEKKFEKKLTLTVNRGVL